MMDKSKTENIEFQKENAQDENKENEKEFTAEEEQKEVEVVTDEDFSEKEGIDEIQIELSREELIDELQQKNEKIEEMDAEIEDLLSRLQRLKADFVNYRKRSQKEKSKMTDQGKRDLCSSLLPTIDNFERALKSEEKETDFYQGVKMIYKQLMMGFAEQNIEEITAAGEEFNPEYHEAIMKVESDEVEDGVIVDVVQKGFILEDKVIRPAMVRVAG